MCDVSSDGQIAKLFEELKSRYGVLHGIVHSVAFAPAEELKGEFSAPRAKDFASRTTSACIRSSRWRARRSADDLRRGIVTMTYRCG